MRAVKSLSFTRNSITEDILKRMMEDQVEEVRETAKEALCNKEGIK